MPEYLSPGVYVEEIDAGPQPIAAVPTSTAGIVGVARRGPATPTLVTSYGDFLRTYGGPMDLPTETEQSSWATRGRYWNAAEGVKAFFDEGGARLYFQRVQPSGSAAARRSLNGGLFALLASDVTPTTRTLTLTHVVDVAANTTLDLISAEDGSSLGQVTVASVDYATRTVTLTADAGVSARSGRDVVRIVGVDTQLDHALGDRRERGHLGQLGCGQDAARRRGPAESGVSRAGGCDRERDHGRGGRGRHHVAGGCPTRAPSRPRRRPASPYGSTAGSAWRSPEWLRPAPTSP